MKQRVHDNPQRPNINLITMPNIIDDLRSQIVGRPTNSLPLLARVLNPGGKAKVSNLNLHILIKHNIA